MNGINFSKEIYKNIIDFEEYSSLAIIFFFLVMPPFIKEILYLGN